MSSVDAVPIPLELEPLEPLAPPVDPPPTDEVPIPDVVPVEARFSAPMSADAN